MTDYDRMVAERYNALALRCDELTKENERLKANQMPEGAVCFVPTGGVRCPRKGDSFKTIEGAFHTTTFDWPGMATEDNLDRSIYRRVEAQSLPAKADWQDHSVDANKMVAEPAPAAEKEPEWRVEKRDGGYSVVNSEGRTIADGCSFETADKIAAAKNCELLQPSVHQKLEAAERELADLRKCREAWDAVMKWGFKLGTDGTSWWCGNYSSEILEEEMFADPIEAVLALKAQLEGK